MDNFQAKYKDYDSVKNAITGADDLKQLCRVPAFWNSTSWPMRLRPANGGDLKAMESRLDPGGNGPLPQPGDTIRWMEVDHPDEFDRARPPRRRTNGTASITCRCSSTPDASMTKDSGKMGPGNAHAGQTQQNGSRGRRIQLRHHRRQPLRRSHHALVQRCPRSKRICPTRTPVWRSCWTTRSSAPPTSTRRSPAVRASSTGGGKAGFTTQGFELPDQHAERRQPAGPAFR